MRPTITKGIGVERADQLLHIWEFRDGLMSRENVWLDGAAIVAQLTTPDLATTST